MSKLHQKEKLILSKYMQAEDVRTTHKIIKETIELMKYQPRLKLYKISKHQMELEDRLAEAWKIREEKQNQIHKKYRLQSLDEVSILNRKIKKESKLQENKFIRNEKPNRPLLEPLPYMKKIRENISKSMEIIEKEDPKRSSSPEVTYFTKRVKFELVNKAAPSALQRKNTKKFYTDIKSKAQG